MRACAFGLKQSTLNLLIIMLEERKFIIVISEKSSYLQLWYNITTSLDNTACPVGFPILETQGVGWR